MSMEGAPMAILTCAVAGRATTGARSKARSSMGANLKTAEPVARDCLMVVFSLGDPGAWHVPSRGSGNHPQTRSFAGIALSHGTFDRVGVTEQAFSLPGQEAEISETEGAGRADLKDH